MSLYASETVVRSAMIRSLHSWWLSKCAGDIPDRGDLDPADVKPLLANLFVADVEHHPFRIRYRLVGTRVTEARGMDITGNSFGDEGVGENESRRGSGKAAPWSAATLATMMRGR